MEHFATLLVAALLLNGAVIPRSAAAEVRLRREAANTLLQVQGDHDNDWHLEVSANFSTWTRLTNFGTLIGGKATNAPWRSAGATTNAQQFFRALKTGGLYDPALFRAVSLVLTQSDWPTRLANGRNTGSNTPCTVFLDNGATNVGVGARYKGNTSYTSAGRKKSINLEFDFINTNANVMTYQTVNLNNAAGDETIMREPLYFNVMHHYAPSPQGAMARVFINGGFWGVYSLIQQENSQLIKEWFPSANGDRWRAPNIGVGGGLNSSNSAFAYFGTNVSSYLNRYELKTDNAPTATAWQRLISAIAVLNITPTNQLRDEVENVFAVDTWLWFLAVENLFADDDSYFKKGADYGFYYEPESGRIHPVEHDGNEAFTAGDVSLSPVAGATGNNRPLLYRLLSINGLRQRYLAHMRTVIQEYYNPGVMTSMIDAYHVLSINAVIADTNKSYAMETYTNDLFALKAFVTNRYNYLIANAELTPRPPIIGTVTALTPLPTPTQAATINASVTANGTNGIDSVWLYYRDKPYGRFATVQMFDDGAHGDGPANNGTFGAATSNFPAGNKIHFYVEARSANATRAAAFAPARAEHVTFDYLVATPVATNTAVVLNELMASNVSTIRDPQGHYDDWIELRNITEQEADLTGHYLSDEPNNPRKWPFPAGTIIPANGFLIVWADEDGMATVGLHANFKLSAAGETIFLVDTDTNLNAVLDSVTFGAQTNDFSFGRTAADPARFQTMSPTPDAAND